MKPEQQRFAVLAIDDTPANVQVLTAALAADFKVQMATSGATGLEVCRRLKLDPLLQADMPIGLGDAVLLFSDGVTEAHNARGEKFAMVPLSAPFESWPRGGACSCPARVDSLNQALHGFTRGAQVLDDQTPLMVELLARNEEGASHET